MEPDAKNSTTSQGAFRRSSRPEKPPEPTHLELPAVRGIPFEEGLSRFRRRFRKLGVRKKFYRGPSDRNAVEYFVPPNADIPQGWLAVRHPETLKFLRREKPYLFSLVVIVLFAAVTGAAYVGYRAYRKAKDPKPDYKPLDADIVQESIRPSAGMTALLETRGKMAFQPFATELEKENKAGNSRGLLRVMEKISNQPTEDPWFWLVAAMAVEPHLKMEVDSLKIYRQKFYERAVENGGSDPAVLTRSAEYYSEVGQHSRSLELLKRAHKLLPESPYIVRSLAASLLLAGEIDEAIDVQKAFVTAHSENPDVRINLASAMMDRGRLEEALEQLNFALKSKPHDLQALRKKAIILVQNAADKPKVLEFVNQTLEVHPDDPMLLELRGMAQITLTDWQGALDTFEKAARLRARDAIPVLGVDTQTNYAVALHQLGREQEAILAYKKAISYQPSGAAIARGNLAFLLLKSDRDPAEAYIYAKRAAELAPNNPNILDTWGCAMMWKKQYLTARDTFAQAISLSKRPDGEIYDHLGDAEAALGNQEAAHEAWTKALANYHPHPERVRKKLGLPELDASNINPID